MASSIVDVQGLSGNWTSHALSAFAANPANGDAIVVAYGHYQLGSATPLAPTDNYGNTYTQIGTKQVVGGSTSALTLWLAANITGGSGFVVTVHPNGTYTACVAWCLRGVTASPYNGDFLKAGAAAGTGLNQSPGTSATPPSPSIFFGADVVDGNEAPADPTGGWNTTGANGFTSTLLGRARIADYTANYDIYTAYKRSAAAETPVWTEAGIQRAWAAALFSLAEASANVLAVTLDGVALVATAVTPLGGTVTATLAALTLTASTISVDTTVHLDALVVTATGTVPLAAVVTATLDPLSGASTGAFRVAAAVTATLDAAALVSQGWVNTTPGVVTQTLAALTLAATGTALDRAAVLAVTLEALTLSATVGWPAIVALRPAIEDDGWGGALTYAWTQVSGPATATIVSPATRWTDVRVSEAEGVYIFALDVSRADDGLVGRGLVRVRVLTDADVTPLPLTDDDPVTLTVNGVLTRAIINTTRIDKPLRQTPTAAWTMYGADIDVGNDVVLERGGVRLFGGVVVAVTVTDEEGHPFLHPSAVGYAWHLGRAHVTATYTNESISAIAADLLARAPGGITGEGIQAGLPAVTVTFDDVPIADALTQLTRMERGLHVTVDDHKRLHVATVEPDDAPAAWSDRHPSSVRHLAVTRSITQLANRVRVAYTEPPVPTTVGGVPAAPRVGLHAEPAAVVAAVDVGATEIPVASLRGYDPDGGTVRLNGQTIRYAGVETRRQTPVYGQVSFAYASAVAVEAGGELGAALDGVGPAPAGMWRDVTTDVPSQYSVALQTPDGETPLIATFSGPGGFLDGDVYEVDRTSRPVRPDTGTFVTGSPPAGMHVRTVHQDAVEITVLGIVFPATAGDARSAAWARLTALTVYRHSTEPSHPGDATGQVFLVGSLPPRGGTLVDRTSKVHLAPIVEPAPVRYRADGSYVWDPPNTYWLVGCVGVVAPIDASPADPAPPGDGTLTGRSSVVVVDDAAAQADLAARLGGGDTGVIEVSIPGGAIGAAGAWALGRAYLDSGVKDVQTTVSGAVRDADAQPGQVLDMAYDAPFGEASLTIQQTGVTGFEPGIPHWYEVTAARERVAFEDLLP